MPPVKRPDKIKAAVSEMKQPFFIQTTNGKKIFIEVVNHLVGPLPIREGLL